MIQLGAWLLALITPLIQRALIAAGVGAVTYVGLQSALTIALMSAKASFAGMGSDLTNLLAMAGMFQALSIVAGGLVAGVTLMAVTRFSVKAAG